MQEEWKGGEKIEIRWGEWIMSNLLSEAKVFVCMFLKKGWASGNC